MFRTIALTIALAAALTACGNGGGAEQKPAKPVKPAIDNSFAVVSDVRGGLGKKGASYVTCVSPSGEFNVYVPPEKNHLFAAGQPCPDGGRW